MKINDRGLALALSLQINDDNSPEFSDAEIKSLTELSWSENGEAEAYSFWKPISNTSQFPEFTSLKMLAIQGNYITDFSPIGACTTLEEFWGSDNDIKSLAGLETLVNLHTLQLSGSNSLKDISAVRGMTALKTLGLRWSPSIEDFSPLLDVPSLKKVGATPKVDDETAIAVFAELRERGVHVETNDEASRAIETYRAKSMNFEDDAVAAKLAQLGFESIAALWVQKGPNGRDGKLNTPLHLLLSVPADSFPEDRDTVLTDLAKMMLDAGADPLAQRCETYQETPLALALRAERNPAPLSLITLLAKAQTDWSVPYRYGTPLAIVFESNPKRMKDETKERRDQRAEVLFKFDDAVTQGDALAKMCGNGDIDHIIAALNRGADPNTTFCNDTPLFEAVSTNRLDVVQLLLDRGADLHQRGYSITSPLPIHGVRSVEMLNLLLENGADVCSRTELGASVLVCAIERAYQVESLVPLLEALSPHNNPGEAMRAMVQLLGEGRRSDHEEILKFVEESEYWEFDLNSLGRGTAFEEFGPRMNTDHKKTLNTKFRDPFGLKGGKTETHFKQLNKFLLGKKAKWELGETGWRGAIKCFTNSNVSTTVTDELRAKADELVGPMLEAGSDVAKQLGKLPDTDLMRAVRMLWLANRDGVDASDEFGRTALHLLCLETEPEIVDLVKSMVAEGASIEQGSYGGRVALDFALVGDHSLSKFEGICTSNPGLIETLINENNAASLSDLLGKMVFKSSDHEGEKFREVVEILVEKNVPFSAKAFADLCGTKFIDLVKIALERGAAANGVGVERATPLSVAARSNQSEIIDLLLEHGADPNARLETHHSWALANASSLEIAKKLVAAGANPLHLSTRNDGKSAAHVIANYLPAYVEPVALLKFFHEAGVDFERPDSRGETVQSMLERVIADQYNTIERDDVLFAFN